MLTGAWNVRNAAVRPLSRVLKVSVGGGACIVIDRNNPQHVKTGEDTPITVKLIPTKRPSLNNKYANFFALLTKLQNNSSTMEIQRKVLPSLIY